MLNILIFTCLMFARVDVPNVDASMFDFYILFNDDKLLPPHEKMLITQNVDYIIKIIVWSIPNLPNNSSYFQFFNEITALFDLYRNVLAIVIHSNNQFPFCIHNIHIYRGTNKTLNLWPQIRKEGKNTPLNVNGSNYHGSRQ